HNFSPHNIRSSIEEVVKTRLPFEAPVRQYSMASGTGRPSARLRKETYVPLLDHTGSVTSIIYTITDLAFDNEESELSEHHHPGIKRAYQLLQQAPVAVCIVTGPDYRFELANEGMLRFLGRTSAILGQTLGEALPEAEVQGLKSILDEVRRTGNISSFANFPATLLINGVRELRYFDLVFKPYYERSEDKEVNTIFCVAHNVTEQVLTLQRVEEVKDALNFRNAVLEAQNEATPDGILIVDAKGKTILHNRRYAEIWNMPPEIVAGKNDEAALRHAMTQVRDPNGFIERVRFIYSQRVALSQEEIQMKDGRVIERNGTPIIAENGLYYGWAWYFRDVTARIRQEQKFRNVVQQASDPILILKGEEMVLEVANAALFQLWRVDESAIGKTFLEILPEMKGQGFLELLQNVYHTGEAFHGHEVPAVFQRADGTEETVYFNFVYQPYREVDGEITGVLVLATDVSGQVAANQRLIESERNFRNMILQAPVAMCILKGSTFVLEIANDRMFELLGKAPGEIMNLPLFTGLPEVALQGLEPLLRKVFMTGAAASAYGIPASLSRSGLSETVYISFTCAPLREGDGTVSGIMTVAVDVTAQVMAERTLRQSAEELELSVQQRTVELESKNREMEQFTYAASHDMQEPLRKVHTFTSLLLSEHGTSLNAQGKLYLEKIEASVNRMKAVIDGLLNYSHQTKSEQESSELDLTAVLQNIEEDLEMVIQKKGASVVYDRLPNVVGVPTQMNQLFYNLVNNGLKFARPDFPPRITLTAEKADAALVQEKGLDVRRSYLLVECADNGIGFEQQYAEQIFQLFKRLHARTEYEGTGIGLALCKKIVDNHGGSIWATSKKGEGTTFHVLLTSAS
ncbi:MAG TPA: PAS domain-containing protein, partial [Flavisolibacter sp.]